MEGEVIVSVDCVNPAEIKEGDLMAYVDGEAGKGVAEHIHRCPACGQRVEELATLQATLSTRLYRQACPAPEQLIAYHQSGLEGGAALVVGQHLRQCPHCARELADLARQERSGLLEWLQAAVKVVEAVLATPQAPAGEVAGVRAGPRGIRPTPQVYRAGEVELILSQHTSPTQPRQPDLSGLVHAGGQVPETIGGARVELYRGGGLIAITQVSPRGHFFFDALEAADYDLSLVWAEREIRLKGVRVG
jgi:hypothetical protein